MTDTNDDQYRVPPKTGPTSRLVHRAAKHKQRWETFEAWMDASPIPGFLLIGITIALIALPVRACRAHHCSEVCGLSGDTGYIHAMVCRCVAPNGKRYHP